MKLTGQAKVDFEKWFKDSYGKTPYEGHAQLSYWGRFSALPVAMQYSVYVDFSETEEEITRFKMVEYEQSLITGGHTRFESRQFSVGKFNKRYNEKN